MEFICETCYTTGDNKCATDGKHLALALIAWSALPSELRFQPPQREEYAYTEDDVDADAAFLRKYQDCYPAV